MNAISEKDYILLTISINKALNPTESPMKMKHVRSVIITTHRTKECKSFWQSVTRPELMESRFIAWKFCHLLHKVLRDGHPSAIRHSQSHKKMILEMGKLWGHLKDGVGNCIQAYSKLLVTKLEFHVKNAFFPGSLIIDFREIEKYTSNDINLYFQLAVEIFDYLDDIIDVQAQVFSSVHTYRTSSMTPQGQFRLAPLITLIQDSNPLYDMCVRIMFKLHDQLPNDLLTGHRERFRELFGKLKQFYDNARPLQYFDDLIQVPHLPDHVPNFSSKVDFGTYTPPVVLVQPDPEPAMEQLIDTDNNSSNNIPASNTPSQEEVTQLEHALQEREHQMHALQYEVAQTRDTLRAMEDTYRNEMSALRQETTKLNTELIAAKELCTELRTQNEQLNAKLDESRLLLQKNVDEQDKAKVSEEKFNKLKTMYTQIRDEHINLLRQHGESTKMLSKQKDENAELRNELGKLSETEQVRTNELSKQNTTLSAELITLQQQNENLKAEMQTLQKNYEELQSNNKNEIDELLQQTKKAQKEAEQLVSSQAQQLETDRLVAEQNLQTQREQLANAVKLHAAEIENLQAAQNEAQLQCEKYKQQNDELHTEQQNLKQTIKQTETQIQQLQQQVISLENNNKEQQQSNKCLIKAVLEAVQHALQHTQDTAQHSCYAQALESVHQLENLIPNLEATTQPAQMGSAAVLLGQHFTQLQLQTAVINSTAANVSAAQELYEHVVELSEPVMRLCGMLNNESEVEVKQLLQELRAQLECIKPKLMGLKQMSEAKTELGDLVVNELSDMDKAIAEATDRFIQLLSETREKDEGIKLEVNGKILDACTTLMECIKQLIERARKLQEEIVSIGRGSTSVTEFYKRNTQWSEGLISAAKSVAKGANLLLDAADKATNEEKPSTSQYFQILVAAQEIAAYVAQLVVASKVKAPKNSERLSALQTASRSVSMATGAVVATVRDCNKYLDQPEPVDITKLNSSQAKTMEMEIHVRVLELEQALQMERLKLASFRRANYQNTQD